MKGHKGKERGKKIIVFPHEEFKVHFTMAFFGVGRSSFKEQV